MILLNSFNVKSNSFAEFLSVYLFSPTSINIISSHTDIWKITLFISFSILIKVGLPPCTLLKYILERYLLPMDHRWISNVGSLPLFLKYWCTGNINMCHKLFNCWFLLLLIFFYPQPLDLYNVTSLHIWNTHVYHHFKEVFKNVSGVQRNNLSRFTHQV